MRAEGLEPSISFEHQVLGLACIPVPARPRVRPIVGPMHPLRLRTYVRMYGRATITAALRLVDDGLNDSQVARRMGIPRTTIGMWRRGDVPRQRRELCDVCAGRSPAVPAAEYCYLLGLYLGDGCISRNPRTYRMRIVLDAKYQRIIASCAAALEAICPGKTA
jgi:hypothetical protein